MGLSKTERDRAERKKREAAWEAESERVRKLGELFDGLPASPQKAALLDAMTDRVVELYNHVRFEEGDAILEFLPSAWARQLLDWYFDDDETSPYPAEASASQNEDRQSGEVQDKPQGPLGANRRDVLEEACESPGSAPASTAARAAR